jgi:hypothetical protein
MRPSLNARHGLEQAEFRTVSHRLRLGRGPDAAVEAPGGKPRSRGGGQQGKAGHGLPRIACEIGRKCGGEQAQGNGGGGKPHGHM